MKHVTQEYRIKCLPLRGNTLSIKPQVVYFCGCVFSYINPHDPGCKQRSEVVCDETVAATNVKNTCPSGQVACDFQCHVVGSSDISATPLSSPPALNRFEQAVSAAPFFRNLCEIE
jgi:hypothetical protein